MKKSLNDELSDLLKRNELEYLSAGLHHAATSGNFPDPYGWTDEKFSDMCELDKKILHILSDES